MHPITTLADLMVSRRLNHHKVWASYLPAGGLRPSQWSARDRLVGGGTVIVANRARFQIKPGATVYTIGSCFARNVERALKAVGCIVPTADFSIPTELYAARTPYTNTVLNKYTPQAIGAELLFGLIGLPFAAPVEIANEAWIDPMAPVLRPLPRETLDRLRQQFEALARTVKSADAVFLTLGLTESFYDIKTGGVYNGFSTEAVRNHQREIGFFNATVDQTVAVLSQALEKLYALNPATKVVVTVSPIPLSQTFTDMDVISANAYSKATLRVSCEMLRKQFDFVDYFPSYEMVMHSPPAATWLNDRVHVQQSVVDRVIATFAERYIEQTSSAPPTR